MKKLLFIFLLGIIKVVLVAQCPSVDLKPGSTASSVQARTSTIYSTQYPCVNRFAAPCAAIEINFTNKGILFDWITTVQRDSIVNPYHGLVIPNKDSACWQMYDSMAGKWNCFATADKAWMLNGNTDIPSNSHLGTETTTDPFLLFTSQGFPSGYLGDDNTLFGYKAMDKWARINAFSGGAIDNIAIGTLALAHCSSCLRNTSIGTNSLVDDVSSHDNVAVGYQCGAGGYSGSHNVCIGNFISLAAGTKNSVNIGPGVIATTGAMTITDSVTSIIWRKLIGALTTNAVITSDGAGNFTAKLIESPIYIATGPTIAPTVSSSYYSADGSYPMKGADSTVPYCTAMKSCTIKSAKISWVSGTAASTSDSVSIYIIKISGATRTPYFVGKLAPNVKHASVTNTNLSISLTATTDSFCIKSVTPAWAATKPAEVAIIGELKVQLQ